MSINVGKYKLNIMPGSPPLAPPMQHTGHAWETDADLIPYTRWVPPSELERRRKVAANAKRKHYEKMVAERMPEGVSYDHATRTYTFEGNGAGPSQP